jgi:hypothetical protein
MRCSPPSFTHILCGHFSTANVNTDELVTLAEEKGSLFWKALATLIQGSVLALTGKASEAIRVLNSGIVAARSTGTTLWMPSNVTHLARAYTDLGQFDEAWRCISEATTAIRTTKESWWEAETLRIAGQNRGARTQV